MIFYVLHFAERCIGCACFLAWGGFLATCPLFSRLLKYFLECLPASLKTTCLLLELHGKTKPCRILLCFYRTGPPSSNAHEHLFHPLSLVSGFFVAIWLSFTIKCQSLCNIQKKFVKCTVGRPCAPCRLLLQHLFNLIVVHLLNLKIYCANLRGLVTDSFQDRFIPDHCFYCCQML